MIRTEARQRLDVQGWCVIELTSGEIFGGHVIEKVVAGKPVLFVEPPDGIDAGNRFIFPAGIRQVTLCTHEDARIACTTEVTVDRPIDPGAPSYEERL